jgi:hypothetical protein
MFKTRAREGDLVQTSDGLFFDVKGLLHPPDRIVAYLRYYPDNRGSRLRDRVRYVKVYDLPKRRLLLEKRWPRYLYYDEIQGRELQGVPKDNVLNLHRPEQRLVTLLHAKRRDRLEASAVRLIELLSQESGFPLTRFGISGSLLVGLHRRDSDIDVVAYGAEVAERVRRGLLVLLERNKYFHRYNVRDLRRLHARRSLQQAITLKNFELQESRKAFQGKFLTHDYFIRCIKNWKEVSEHYGETRYASMGECTVVAQVVDDTESLQTPCRYLIKKAQVLRGPISHKLREIVSFRGRFAEQACEGERIFARGRLEGVRSKQSQYARLVIGEGRTDILRTIW